MAVLHTGDRICASCGGINGRHRAACFGDESIDVLNVYTRRQAIEDGILVDCEQAPMGEMCRQLMKWSLAMTTTAFHRYVWPIDENAVLDRLPARVGVDYFNRVSTGARRLVMAVHASARRTNAVACM